MEATTDTSKFTRQDVVYVNENLSIELTLDEILGDLLYPAASN